MKRKRRSTMKARNQDDTTGTEEAPSYIDAKALMNSLRRGIKAAGGTKAFIEGAGGAEALVNKFMKPFFELLLEAEMEEHLGYAKHSPEEKETLNRRNGKGSKKVRGNFGQIEVETPRDREGTFEPQIVKKRQSSFGGFTDKVISLYARGMSTREIEEHLKDIYGIDVSPQFISRATARLEEALTEWQNRPLERLYAVVYVDGLMVSVKSGDNKGPVTKKCVYVVLGVSIDGKQDVLGLWVEETEGARFWLKVFNDLKARGTEDILILCGDGLKGLPEAVASVYPLADVQQCVVHHIRNVTRFVAWKDRRQFCMDMRPIYTAPTLEACQLAFEQFAAKWGTKYPNSIESWRRNWDKLTAFFKYPVELRRVIYTTNTIESLNAQLRKNISNRKVLPNDQSVLRLLFINLSNFSRRWTKRREWDIVMNQLSLMFAERINRALDENRA
jgi:transposase-like protein